MILFVCSRPIWKKAIICHMQLHVHNRTILHFALWPCVSEGPRIHPVIKWVLSGGDLLSIVLCLLCVFWTEEWSLFLCGSFGCPRGRAAVAATRLSVSLQFHCPALPLFKPSSPLSCSPLHLSLHSQRPPFSLQVLRRKPPRYHTMAEQPYLYQFLHLFIYSPGYFWSAVDYDLLIMG